MDIIAYSKYNAVLTNTRDHRQPKQWTIILTDPGKRFSQISHSDEPTLGYGWSKFLSSEVTKFTSDKLQFKYNDDI